MPTGAQKLYVANCSRQLHDFTYRVVGEPKLRRQRIDIGSQILVGNQEGLPPEVVENIIKHYETFGIIHVKDIKRDTPHTGLCYQLDKPITMEDILGGMDHNDGVLQRHSADNREMFAVAADHQHREVAGKGLQSLTFEVQEVTENPNANTVNERTKVTHNEAPSPRRQKGGRR